MRRWHLSASLLLLYFHILWAPLFVASLSTPFLLLPSRHISTLELCCFLHRLWLHLTGILTTPLFSHWPFKCYLASLISINHFTPPSKNLSDSMLTKALRSMVRASLNPFLTLPDFSFPLCTLNSRNPSPPWLSDILTLMSFPDPTSLGRASFPSLWVQILPLFLEPTLMIPGPQGVPDATQRERVLCVCVCVCVCVCLTPLPSWRDWSMRVHHVKPTLPRAGGRVNR